MKNRILFSALLFVMLIAGAVTTASAQCWERRPHHRGYYGPRVSVCAPVRVYVPPIVVGGGYYGYRHCPPPPPPRYYAYHRPRHYRYYQY